MPLNLRFLSAYCASLQYYHTSHNLLGLLSYETLDQYKVLSKFKFTTRNEDKNIPSRSTYLAYNIVTYGAFTHDKLEIDIVANKI